MLASRMTHPIPKSLTGGALIYILAIPDYSLARISGQWYVLTIRLGQLQRCGVQ